MSATISKKQKATVENRAFSEQKIKSVFEKKLRELHLTEAFIQAFLEQAFAEMNAEAVQKGEPLRATMERGSGKHLILHIADDFEDPIPEFAEYMAL